MVPHEATSHHLENVGCTSIVVKTVRNVQEYALGPRQDVYVHTSLDNNNDHLSFPLNLLQHVSAVLCTTYGPLQMAHPRFQYPRCFCGLLHRPRLRLASEAEC